MMETYITETNGLPTINKAAGATLDYSFDWSEYLAAIDDTMTTHQVTVPAGISKASEMAAGGVVTAWLSGGKPGVKYPVKCRITTSGGRTDERTIVVVVVVAK